MSLKVTAKYNLGKLYPRLAAEWDYKKNHPLTPFQFTPGSGKKFWWKCSEGHEWPAEIYNRVYGRGCPDCAGKRVSKDNNLAVRYPELAKEWHPTKNGDLKPEDVMPGSRKKVWWQCKKKHSWPSSLYSRKKGNGCPECAKEKRVETFRKTILKKRGSLAKNYPKIAKEWHPTKNLPLTPSQVTSGSRRKVWWLCKSEHEWIDTISHRTSGRGCHVCNKEKAAKNLVS